MDDKYASDDEIDMLDSDIDENENVLELPKMVLKETKIKDDDLDDDDDDGDDEDGDEDADEEVH